MGKIRLWQGPRRTIRSSVHSARTPRHPSQWTYPHFLWNSKAYTHFLCRITSEAASHPMIESCYWKEELKRIAKSIRRTERPARWSERALCIVERDLMLGFF